MILDEKLLYKITIEDLIEFEETAIFPCMAKVLQNVYIKFPDTNKQKTHASFTSFRRFLKKNISELLKYEEEEFNSIIYHKVERLVESYPEEFPKGYGWYSKELIVSAFENGDIVWKLDFTTQ